MAHDDGSIHFYLHGKHDGRDIELPLSSGELTIGSSRFNDLRLKLDGISRKHALLEVSESTVTVIDCNSTNGITVDGLRVERSTLVPGSKISFGPVELRLSGSPDVELAVALELTSPESRFAETFSVTDSTTSAGGFQDRPTQAMPETQAGDSSLKLFEACLSAFRGGAAGLEPGLQVVAMSLQARGVAFVRWHDTRPSVISLHGELGSVPDLKTVLDSRTALHSLEWRATWSLPEPLSALIKRRSDGSYLAILAWITSQDAPFPGGLVSLFELAHQAGPDSIPTRESDTLSEPDLRLPPGHKRGTSTSMIELYDQMRALLQGSLPVLISGETGVGKEGIARTLHLSSDRCNQPFVAINCAAIPEDLLEAELFGVEKGAATGVTSRPGCFREADRGIIFLDEIGEMPMGLQAKLLRTLQEGEVRPIGGRPIKLDVRVLSATNVDLDSNMEGGSLRRDLFYRLAGFVLNVPPLRQRRTDIPGLIEHLLRQAVQERSVPIRGLSVQAMRQLVAYDWPGNVRQLEHEVRGAAYRCSEGGIIQAGMLSEALQTAERQPSEQLTDVEPIEPDEQNSDLRLGPQVEALERRVIRQALQRTAGNRKLAAVLLGISRNGLALKLDRLGIEIKSGKAV